MLTQDNQKKIIASIEEEAMRISYGKVLIEATVVDGQVTNVMVETKRSINIK